MADDTPEARTDVRDKPHYILATLAGEQSAGRFNPDLHVRNRGLWHRWATQDLDDDALQALIDAGTIPAEDVADRSLAPVREAARARGLKALPGPRDTIDFAGTDWPEAVVSFAGFWFPASVNFSGIQLKGGIDLSRATFLHEAAFMGTKFGIRTFFEGAMFEEKAFFVGATFKGSTDFPGATFKGGAGFDDATFEGYATFEGATFVGYADFEGATFERAANFDGATFEGMASFTNAAFSGLTVFRQGHFASNVPTFFGARLHEGTFFHDVTWPPVPRDDRDEARFQADAYERLKLEMDRLNRHEAELDFFARELSALRHCQPWHRAWLIAAYHALSGYGLSLSKPLLWAALFWELGAVLYWWAGCSAGAAAGFSAASLGGLLGLRREIYPDVLASADWPVVLLSAGQSVLGALLMFLVGLALRNRFRIR